MYSLDLTSLVVGLVIGIQVSVILVAIIAYRSKPVSTSSSTSSSIAVVAPLAVSNTPQLENVGAVKATVAAPETVDSHKTLKKSRSAVKKGRMPSWWYRDLNSGRKNKKSAEDVDEAAEDSADLNSSGSFNW